MHCVVEYTVCNFVLLFWAFLISIFNLPIFDSLSFNYVVRCLRSELFTTVTMTVGVFWDVTPCSLVEVCRRFKGFCCLRHQGG
jgi:hypothetical protein